MLEPGPDERVQTAKILASSQFLKSPRMSRFLSFVVEEALSGRSDGIEESVIGVEVFEKVPGYDPRLDATVRTEAAKLRSKLQAYYETEGRGDPIVISIPKGGYAAVFAGQAGAIPEGSRWGFSRFAGTAAALLCIAVLSALVLSSRGPAPVLRQRRDRQQASRLSMKAQELAATATRGDMQRAIEYFDLAIAADPAYAVAHANLSLIYAKQAEGENGQGPNWFRERSCMPRRRTAGPLARRSHHAMAWALLLSDYDWEGSDREFRQAVAIDPAYQEARYNYAHISLNPRRLLTRPRPSWRKD